MCFRTIYCRQDIRKRNTLSYLVTNYCILFCFFTRFFHFHMLILSGCLSSDASRPVRSRTTLTAVSVGEQIRCCPRLSWTTLPLQSRFQRMPEAAFCFMTKRYFRHTGLTKTPCNHMKENYVYRTGKGADPFESYIDNPGSSRVQQRRHQEIRKTERVRTIHQSKTDYLTSTIENSEPMRYNLGCCVGSFSHF